MADSVEWRRQWHQPCNDSGQPHSRDSPQSPRVPQVSMTASPQPNGGNIAERQGCAATDRIRCASYLPPGDPEILPRGRSALPWLRSTEALVLCLIVAGIAVRLILARAIGLGVDESYQVSVSWPFSLSYFEHPPLAFWIPGAVRALTGEEQRVLLRLPFILLFGGTTWMMYSLGKRLFGARAGAIAALILNVTPVFSLSAGSWILPDGPLMFWMLATALCLERVLLPRDRSNISPTRETAWWIAAGACAGLSLLSKYHGVFLLAGTGLFLLTWRDARRWLRHPAPYLGAATAMALFSPVLIWNARHDWVSFRFQGGRGTTFHGVHLLSLLENVAGQAAYLLPWLFIPLAWVLGSALIDTIREWSRRASRREDAARWMLVCLGIGPIATFTIISLAGSPGLPHWESPGWLMIIPLLAAAVDNRLTHGSAHRRRRTKQWLLGSSVVYVVLVTLAVMQARSGWLERTAPSLVAHGDPTVDTIDWLDLRAAISPWLNARSTVVGQRGERPFVAVTNWMDAGKTAYALGDGADVVCLCDEPHHFAYLHDLRSYVARDAVIIERAGVRPQAPVTLARYFRSVVPVGSTVLRRGGEPVITLMFYRGVSLTPSAIR